MTSKRARRIAGLAIVIVYLFSINPVWAGDPESGRTFGLSATIQGKQLAIQVPAWLSGNTVLALSGSGAYVGDAASDFGLGVGVRFYSGTGATRPYWGLRVGAMALTPEGGDTTVDFIAGPMLGGEYFLNDRFSLGVEAQANLAFSAKDSYRFGNPDGTTINSATTAMVTFYF